MEKRILLQEDSNRQLVKDLALVTDPAKLKLLLNPLSWKILKMLSQKEMYSMEIARNLGMHEQKVYYHIRKLRNAGAVTLVKEEEMKGAAAKFYRATATAFGIEISSDDYRIVNNISKLTIDGPIHEFFKGFVRRDGMFDGKIVVGSPTPHGPFKTSARDGHYASHLTFFLGQFAKPPQDFAIKLDVDVKAEKEEKNNLILVGGPGTNLLTEEVNNFLPIKFNMRASEEGFLFGGLISKKTSRIYTADATGVLARVVNPWDDKKHIIVLAGNKAVGTKACVLALTDFWKKTLKDFAGEDPYAKIVQGFDLNGDGKVDSIEVLE